MNALHRLKRVVLIGLVVSLASLILGAAAPGAVLADAARTAKVGDGVGVLLAGYRAVEIGAASDAISQYCGVSVRYIAYDVPGEQGDPSDNALFIELRAATRSIVVSFDVADPSIPLADYHVERGIIKGIGNPDVQADCDWLRG